METKETIEKYFAAIHGGGWENYIVEDFIYANSFLDRVLNGKTAYVEAASRFFSSTTSVELKHIIVEGDRRRSRAYPYNSPSNIIFRGVGNPIFLR